MIDLANIYKRSYNRFSNNGTSKDAVLWGNFSISPKNGKHSLNILLFNDSFPFSLDSTFQFSQFNSYSILTIKASAKGPSEPMESISFRTDNYFGNCDGTITSTICEFLSTLVCFDSLSDAKFIYSLRDPLTYQNPDDLIEKIVIASEIFKKYFKKENFSISYRLKEWLKTAISRYGYKLQLPSQEDFIDSKLLEVSKILNQIGYIIAK